MKSISFIDTLRKEYNWLTSKDLLPANMKSLTDKQPKLYPKRFL